MTAPGLLDLALGTLPEPVITGTFSGAGRHRAPRAARALWTAPFRQVTQQPPVLGRRSTARHRSSVALSATPTVVSRLLPPTLLNAD